MGGAVREYPRCDVRRRTHRRRPILVRIQLQRPALEHHVKWSGTDAGVEQVAGDKTDRSPAARLPPLDEFQQERVRHVTLLRNLEGERRNIQHRHVEARKRQRFGFLRNAAAHNRWSSTGLHASIDHRHRSRTYRRRPPCRSASGSSRTRPRSSLVIDRRGRGGGSSPSSGSPTARGAYGLSRRAEAHEIVAPWRAPYGSCRPSLGVRGSSALILSVFAAQHFMKFIMFVSRSSSIVTYPPLHGRSPATVRELLHHSQHRATNLLRLATRDRHTSREERHSTAQPPSRKSGPWIPERSSAPWYPSQSSYLRRDPEAPKSATTATRTILILGLVPNLQ